MPREEIAADYHATAGAMAAFVDWLTVTYPEAIDSMTSQPPEYLEAPHEAMADVPRARSTSDHGSMEGYVTGLGVDAATIERLRSTLIAVSERAASRRSSSTTQAAAAARTASSTCATTAGWGRWVHTSTVVASSGSWRASTRRSCDHLSPLLAVVVGGAADRLGNRLGGPRRPDGVVRAQRGGDHESPVRSPFDGDDAGAEIGPRREQQAQVQVAVQPLEAEGAGVARQRPAHQPLEQRASVLARQDLRAGVADRPHHHRRPTRPTHLERTRRHRLHQRVPQAGGAEAVGDPGRHGRHA